MLGTNVWYTNLLARVMDGVYTAENAIKGYSIQCHMYIHADNSAFEYYINTTGAHAVWKKTIVHDSWAYVYNTLIMKAYYTLKTITRLMTNFSRQA